MCMAELKISTPSHFCYTCGTSSVLVLVLDLHFIFWCVQLAYVLPPDSAQSIFQSMKATFGQHSSHLLKINSRSPDASLPGGMPDPWGQYLNRPEQGLAVSMLF